MRRAILAAALAGLALAADGVAMAQGAAAPAAVAAPAAQLSGVALRDALRHGGYVLYMRHTSTDFGQNDDAMATFDDCARQRNLTERGRAEARAVGEAIARLGIPVGEVLASPYCRTLETARLAFGRATVSMDARGGPATPPDAGRYANLRTRLSTPVAAGTNVIVVSHGNPFYALAGPPYLAEGEIAVVEPRGASGFRVVAKVTRDGWPALGG